MRTLAFVSLLGFTAAVAAQPNIRPGTNVTNTLGSLGSPAGAHTGTFPTGQQSWGVTTTSCNIGTINVPWLRDMNVDHPQMGMWMYRLYNGRLEQISQFMGVKHGFTSTNSPGCGSCPGGAGTSLVIGCTDTYGASLNYSHTYMAPPSEIDPWTGVWTSRGSHFDRGFPVVSPPGDTDNVRSGINFGTAHGYRNLVWDSGLNVTGATFFVSAYYVVIGEPDANRENNFATQQFTTSWNGSNWTWNGTSGHDQRPAIYRYTGATVTHANNNNGSDGRFYVAVRVTGPNAGMYHYDYAVMNRDNNRQGGALRIPVCTTATVSNIAFRDVDEVSGTDWAISRSPHEIVFTAPAANANNLSWGNMYNFSFDCDMAPSNGTVCVDQALPGAGNPGVHVVTSVPLNARNVTLGAGCGIPAPVLAGTGAAIIGNSSFVVTASNVAASSTNMFLLSAGAVNLPVPPCAIYVDPTLIVAVLSVAANGSGVATLPLPVPNNAALDGGSIVLQSAEVQVGGAYGGFADLSNGLRVKLGSCN